MPTARRSNYLITSLYYYKQNDKCLTTITIRRRRGGNQVSATKSNKKRSWTTGTMMARTKKIKCANIITIKILTK